MGLEETSTFTYINGDAKIKTVFLKKKKDYRNCNSKAFIQKKIPSAALTKCNIFFTLEIS